MPRPTQDLVEELAVLERARHGDHTAFVTLYRQDAPPAWRLALALTADPERAAQAVAEGFGRALAPGRPGTARRTAEPFRVRLLIATRHAVLDGPAADAPPLLTPGKGLDLTAARPAAVRAAEVMTAFHQLPERSRSMLWLLAVEGLGTVDAGRVLGLRPGQADALTDRALDALEEQWWIDRLAAGEAAGIAEVPEGLERHLQPLLPLPAELFADVERRWNDGRRQRPAGRLRLALPGGRPVARWAERTLIGTTAALIACGIAGAVIVDSDPSAPRVRATVAGAQAHPDVSGPSGTGSAQGPLITGSSSVAGLDGSALGLDIGSVGAAAAGPATPAGVSEAAVPGTVGSTASRAVVTQGTTPPPTTTTTTPPLLQVTAGVAPVLGVAVGSCTGLDLAGTVAGCNPATKASGVTLDVGGSLVGRP